MVPQFKSLRSIQDADDLLEELGAPDRCCRSYEPWSLMDCAFEELMVALADNLWKGKRNTDLENIVVDTCNILERMFGVVPIGTLKNLVNKYL
jgi:hypothetical protein